MYRRRARPSSFAFLFDWRVICLFALALPKTATSYGKPPDEETDRYCRICPKHTMCLYPYDDPGLNCVGLENGDLDAEEIELIVHRHNLFRADIASDGRYSRARQSTFYVMMQVLWDDELARIARRWVLQCNIFERDECRDVGRFAVLQNVNALDLQDTEFASAEARALANHTAISRLEYHMRSWYQEADTAAPVGQLYHRNISDGEGVVGLATPWVTNVGCGRAIYHVDDDSGVQGKVEVLVCNYGPINEAQRRQRCGNTSRQYPELCLNLESESSRGVTPRFRPRPRDLLTLLLCTFVVLIEGNVGR